MISKGQWLWLGLLVIGSVGCNGKASRQPVVTATEQSIVLLSVTSDATENAQ
jgi:hypothetical protein